MKKTLLVMAIVAAVALAAFAYAGAAEVPFGRMAGAPAGAVGAPAFQVKHPLEILAEVSGKTLEEVRALVAGKGVWEAVKELKLEEKFTKAFRDYRFSMIDFMVSRGRLTKEQAAEMKADFDKRVADGTIGQQLGGTCGAGACRGGMRMMGRGMAGRRGCGMKGGYGNRTMQPGGMMNGPKWF